MKIKLQFLERNPGLAKFKFPGPGSEGTNGAGNIRFIHGFIV